MAYQVVNGTSYDADTSAEVIEVLEGARHWGCRIIIYLGDNKTGKGWGDKETGRIGRSTGTNKIPILLFNSRSIGGGGLLDAHIVRILAANGKRVLYTHPNFTEGVS